MRKSKLTIRVPHNLLDDFRRFADENNTTMTSLVEAYLRRSISQKTDVDAPIVHRLSGILSPRVSVEDYKAHLDEKYGG